MVGYIGRRLAAIVPTLLIVTLITFSLLELTPGDPAVTLAGESATPEQIEAIRERLGLDRPFLIRYGDFLLGALQGDLGTSLFNSQPVLQAVFDRFPVTLSLVLYVFVLSILLGVPAGILAARRPNTLIDRAIAVLASFSLAAPTFLIGMVLIVVLSLKLGLLPPMGYTSPFEDFGGWVSRLLMPSIALSMHPAAELARMTRAAMSDTLEKDYIRTAWAKGLRGPTITRKHALKNAAIPVITVIGLQTARVLGGAVIIEQIFAIPGLGTLTIQSVLTRDLSMVMGIVLVASVATVLINLLVDLSYGYFNPRLRK